MKRRFLRVSAVAVLACLVAGGCDSGGGPAPERSPAPENSSAPEKSPAPEAAPGRIAFARRLGALNPNALPGGIYAVDADGSDLVRVTNNERDLDPRWSPDGERIAFQRRSWRRGEAYVVTARRGRGRRMTFNRFPDRDVQWSPDGSRLLVLRDSVKPEAGIFVVSVTDRTETRLTDLRAVEASPEWSPDGRSVLFADWDEKIRIVDVSSGRIVPLTSGFSEAGPRWSPTGDLIAYLGGRRDIWLIRPDGTRRRRLASPGGEVVAFSWSPDGNRIAYVAQPRSEDLARPEPFELHVVAVGDGREVTVVRSVPSARFTPMARSAPAWSPDGTQLAYPGWEDKDRLLWSLLRVAADGDSRPVVIPNTRAASTPDWAP